MTITHINKEETVRVQKGFNDGQGTYYYRLEKLLPPIKFFIFKIPGKWKSGRRWPITTICGHVLEGWIKHYELDEVED